jgi:hypothetical protein
LSAGTVAESAAALQSNAAINARRQRRVAIACDGRLLSAARRRARVQERGPEGSARG